MKRLLLALALLLAHPAPAAEVAIGSCQNLFARTLIPYRDLPVIHIYGSEAEIGKLFPETLTPRSPDYLTGLKKKLAVELRRPMVVRTIYRTLNGKMEKVGDLDGPGLLKLLQPEQRYNLVVLDNEIRLVKAAKDPAGDAVSKHIILADMAPNVRFAGEVWTRGDGVIHVNNNSGTYQPSHEGAMTAAAVLRKLLNYQQVTTEHLDYGKIYSLLGDADPVPLSAGPKAVIPPAPAGKQNPLIAAAHELRMAAIARLEKDRSGQLLSLNNPSGNLSSVVRLGDRLGTGFFGTVYKIKGMTPEPGHIAAYPGNLVVKVPNEYLGNRMLADKAKGEAARELKSYQVLQENLPDLQAHPAFPKDPAWSGLPVVPIVHSLDTSSGTVMFKAEVPGRTLHSMLEAKEGLSPEMMRSLEEIDGFGRAIREKLEYVNVKGANPGSNTRFIIDNNPRNLVWVENPKLMQELGLKRPSFVFYEATPLRNRSGFVPIAETHRQVHALGIDTRAIIPHESVETSAERSLAWVRRQVSGALNKNNMPRWAAPRDPPARLDPKQIYFMQEVAENVTQDGKYTALQTALDFRSGKLKPEAIPPIRVWQDENGRIWTLDHRRLASYRLAGNLESVPVEWAPEELVRQQRFKFNTTTDGKSIKLDLGNDQALPVQ